MLDVQPCVLGCLGPFFAVLLLPQRAVTGTLAHPAPARLWALTPCAAPGPRLLVGEDAVRVLQGLDFGVAALHLATDEGRTQVPLQEVWQRKNFPAMFNNTGKTCKSMFFIYVPTEYLP